jgi:NAD(P)-dependent dehydrogenase (short-subunit alcohol dehydrogenase family)
VNSALNGAVYIVTGGSRGFGLAIAKDLVEHGARVGVISRNADALEKAVAEIGTDHAFGIPGDVSSQVSITAAFAAIKAHFGRLDGLINNAGMARPNPVEKLVEAEVVAQVNTNFLGTVFCCQAVIPLLRGGQNPRIINISSASAWHYDEIAHLSVYAATKAAVERFTRDLRLELQHDGIGVTCIRPGGAMTDFASEWEAQSMTGALEAWLDYGTFMNVGMDASHIGAAVRYAVDQPPGVAVDLLEVRPNVPTPKASF